MTAFLVLASGQVYQGQWQGGEDSVGEVVFNTSHNGYEEIATDPSYYGQIIVMTATQQGNYGVDQAFWESRQIWIRGFIALEIQNTTTDSSWLNRLTTAGVPAMDELDTRSLVLELREQGTQVGAMVKAESASEALEKAQPLIESFKQEQGLDWTLKVTRNQPEVIAGTRAEGPRIALIDYGCKENILRELKKRCREVCVFPAQTTPDEVWACQPQGLLLSNGPGDPEAVDGAPAFIEAFIGKIPIFGICMGHQLLGRALGGVNKALKFGHRGANHPIRDTRTGEVFMTSQNHGYALEPESLSKNIVVTHMNLNDQTVAGIEVPEANCLSVQFHPESHPGPREAEVLFERFIERVQQ